MKSLQLVLLIPLALLLQTKSFGQVEEQENLIANNSIYATGGSVVVSHTISLNYERKFLTGNGLIKQYYAKASYGQQVSLGDTEENFLSIGLTLMTGQKNSHVELNANAIRFDNKDDRSRIEPGGSLAYRYQAPGTSVVFRAGAGWPDLPFISLGFGF